MCRENSSSGGAHQPEGGKFLRGCVGRAAHLNTMLGHLSPVCKRVQKVCSTSVMNVLLQAVPLPEGGCCPQLPAVLPLPGSIGLGAASPPIQLSRQALAAASHPDRSDVRVQHAAADRVAAAYRAR